MRIRSATPEDIPAMLALERRAATAAHWSEAQYARIFAPRNRGRRRVALVIEEDQVVGFLVASCLGPEWEIENVAVAEAAQRRGLGTRLVGELLYQASREQAQSVFLEVRESNMAARALYEKWAFVASGRRKSYYSDPQEDALIYRFSFPQRLAKPVEGA